MIPVSDRAIVIALSAKVSKFACAKEKLKEIGKGGDSLTEGFFLPAIKRIHRIGLNLGEDIICRQFNAAYLSGAKSVGQTNRSPFDISKSLRARYAAKTVCRCVLITKTKRQIQNSGVTVTSSLHMPGTIEPT